MNRRRFLAISAAMLASTAYAAPAVWRGRAFGGEVAITLNGSRHADAALGQIVEDIRRIERKFSLFDPSSELSKLNRDGRIAIDADWHELIDQIDRVHSATVGAFDPTVQPLWRLLAETHGAPLHQDLAAARTLIGWDRVKMRNGELRLATKQALTLNGIAQGFASDRITQRLRWAGFDEVLVNLGEFRAGRLGNWRVGIGETEAAARLRGDALAVSEPDALQLDRSGTSHILGPQGRSIQWQFIAVQAENATLADGLSTGFALMTAPEIEKARPFFKSALLIDPVGRRINL